MNATAASKAAGAEQKATTTGVARRQAVLAAIATIALEISQRATITPPAPSLVASR